MNSRGHLIKVKKKKFKKILSETDKIKRKNTKILRKVSFKVIDNPVKTAITDYNNNNENKITCKTIKLIQMERITLNYIRHNLSNYDLLITRLSVTRNDVYIREFKNDVNEKITKKYGDGFVEEELSLLREENFDAAYNT